MDKYITKEFKYIKINLEYKKTMKRKWESILENLGFQIRKLRKQQNATIKDIATKAKVSPALISFIERGKVNPSIGVLWAISRALGITIESFFGEGGDESPVVRELDRRIIRTEKGIEFQLLSSHLKGKLGGMYKIFEPNACTGEELYTHEGEEIGIVLEGKIQVTLGVQRYVLEKGDSIHFLSTVSHKVKNIGSTKAITIWVLTPPSF